ncbi:MAG: hypothetical protein JSV46_08845, partial [Candidatus Aminicenantes bacterium]
AKAFVIATGMDQMRLFRAQSGDWFNSQSPPYITGDGEAMALRAGAEVKSVIQTASVLSNPDKCWGELLD